MERLGRVATFTIHSARVSRAATPTTAIIASIVLSQRCIAWPVGRGSGGARVGRALGALALWRHSALSMLLRRSSGHLWMMRRVAGQRNTGNDKARVLDIVKSQI